MSGSSVNRLENAWTSTATPPYDAEPQGSWSEHANMWEAKFERFIEEHPKLVVASAAIAGIAIGLLMKRR